MEDSQTFYSVHTNQQHPETIHVLRILYDLFDHIPYEMLASKLTIFESNWHILVLVFLNTQLYSLQYSGKYNKKKEREISTKQSKKGCKKMKQ